MTSKVHAKNSKWRIMLNNMRTERVEEDLFCKEKEDWEVGDESLLFALNLIERDENDPVEELANQFDSVWIDVS